MNRQYYVHKILHNALTFSQFGKSVLFFENNGIEAPGRRPVEPFYRRMLHCLKPMHPVGVEKVRLGSEHDGGYVLADPGYGGIVYSFGIDFYAPWDMDMAQRGFHVYQYDGTIETPPATHEMLHFSNYNISGKDSGEGVKTISEIIRDLGHEHEQDIVLEMDIEGEEWSFFENISNEHIMKFKQMVIEMHHLLDMSYENLKKYELVLHKIHQTHQCIHYHANNYCSKLALFPGFSFPDTLEVTFLRRSDYHFVKDFGEYPGRLDSPNDPVTPDVYIGNLESMLCGED